MKCLYGSQNFGYDTISSDRDYLEVIVPTWNQILSNTVINEEKHLEPNGILKVRDIRNHAKYLIKGHFNTLQSLYSTEYINTSNFEWFINNREEIVRSILWNIYNTNRGSAINQCSKGINTKTYIRMRLYHILLERLLEDGQFSMYCNGLREERAYAENLTDNTLKELTLAELNKIQGLEDKYIVFKNMSTEKIEQKIKEETLRILKNNLMY